MLVPWRVTLLRFSSAFAEAHDVLLHSVLKDPRILGVSKNGWMDGVNVSSSMVSNP